VESINRSLAVGFDANLVAGFINRNLGEPSMLKRSFVISFLAILIYGTPIISTGVSTGFSTAWANEDTIDYSKGDIKTALANGETVFVDYSAEWCGTCKRQERVINQLRSQNPAYNKAITFIRVDWDLYRSDEVTTSRNIPRRSTLIVLKGDRELGRIVAGTREKNIMALLDLGLAGGM
jgi:thioredoxin 1